MVGSEACDKLPREALAVSSLKKGNYEMRFMFSVCKGCWLQFVVGKCSDKLATVSA